jgi:hypothetical protein
MLMNGVVFDWLDQTLNRGRASAADGANGEVRDEPQPEYR